MKTIITHPNEKIMRKLIEEAWRDKGIVAAVINPEGEIIALGETTIWDDHDPTAHAKINAIRNACKLLKTEKLSGFGCIRHLNRVLCALPPSFGRALRGLYMQIIPILRVDKKIGRL